VIPESDIERAVNWMASSAVQAAQARANREYMTEFRKSLKALLMREHQSLPIAAQEREAYADERYLAHLDAMKAAIEEDEKMRWLQSAAEAKVSAWQTQQRAMRT
jgi:phage host-nuclease inhibitor protein Gam